jgi:3'-5' exonuclease
VTTSQHALTEAEQTIWDAALHTLQNLNCPTQDDDEEAEVWVNALVTIVLLGSKQRRAWVPQVVHCVAAQQHDTTWLTHRFDEALKRVHSAVDSDKESSDTPRRVALLQKLQLKVLGGDQVSVEASGRDTGSPARTLEKQRTSNRSRQQAHDLWRSPLGQKGRKQISGLSIQRNLVPSRESLSLRLPEEPTFVDTLAVLNAVIREVQQVSLVAIDTEWMDGDSDVGDVLVGTNRLSTFQVSYYVHQTTPTTSNGAVISHVVDLKPALSSTAYLDAARNLISSILDSSETLILGFSIGHDLKILEQFMGRKLQPTTMLDLQLLLGDGTLGLRACVAKYSRIPLSKEEQCSDWGRRPLSESQLRYAGLDAAILIYLLAAHESQIV